MQDPSLFSRIMTHTQKKYLPIPSLYMEDPFQNEKESEFAICFLVQNKIFAKDDTLGFPRENSKNRIHLFFQSLSYLRENGPRNEQYDIHVFHEGDLTQSQMEKTLSYSLPNSPIFIHEFRFPEPPAHVDMDVVQEKIDLSKKLNIAAYRSIGYRHMCSFYSFYVYPIFHQWGYKKLMRLDDDSYLMEPIETLFLLPEDYVYRLRMNEDPRYMMYFTLAVKSYCKKNKILDANIQNLQDTVFNNFFIVDLSIYKNPQVLDFLSFIYTTGGIYYFRWGDALIQSAIFHIWPHLFKTRQLTFAYQKWGFTYRDDLRENFVYPPTLEPFVVVSEDQENSSSSSSQTTSYQNIILIMVLLLLILLIFYLLKLIF